MFILLTLKPHINVMDNTDQITLTYLSNPIYYSCGTQITNHNTNTNKVSVDEIKFYKKRVHALSKDILKGKTNGINEQVKNAHDEYISSAINYFKMIDTEEILQNEYKHIEEDTCIGTDNTSYEEFDMNDANNIMFPSSQETSTLDDYVTYKKVIVKKPQKHPQKIRLNLKEEKLRLKGIKIKEKKM